MIKEGRDFFILYSTCLAARARVVALCSIKYFFIPSALQRRKKVTLPLPNSKAPQLYLQKQQQQKKVWLLFLLVDLLASAAECERRRNLFDAHKNGVS